ncbi:SusC/RagA family TonB-linked outer membrane protein [Rufibacter sediminis]|uniref:SusC/RagA family TonB-linked outer membrane protein n=1 Tax=Rufibacter sediminis TaxID=2762756 RepID=A0ABR6VQ79_9BACT|nr:SusC/RagA family TonB-linked outer membrane protein [Rufibacter sediminis]MBC3539305.1 SusC/RagA family TonB-linked outer membrane protein [Rufibacter sediminis]
MPQHLLHGLLRRACLSTAILTFTTLAFPALTQARQSAYPTPSDTVQIGYGSQKRKQVTGAVQTVTASQFNQGLIVTPEQLFTGQLTGVQVTALSGAPGANSLIQLQRAASMAGDTAPLVVLDGVLLEPGSDPSVYSPLGLLNPYDIASITFLKDAAATGIYGAQGLNGVLLINTKRGASDRKLQVDFQTQFALSTLPKKVSVLSADEFRQFINQRGRQEEKNLLGQANTDWQDEIYEKAVSYNQNLSLGGTVGFLPYRISLGHLKQNGILTNTNFTRKSAAILLNPSLFDDHLQIQVSLKGNVGETQSANPNLINAAVHFDPTQPVYAPDGSYFEWRDPNGAPITSAPLNPVGLLNRPLDKEEAERGFGNTHIAYQFHFLPALTAHFNWGYDRFQSDRNGNPSYTVRLPQVPETIEQSGQTRKSRQQEYYLTYSDKLERLQSQLDLTAGYFTQKTEEEAYSNTMTVPQGERQNGGWYRQGYKLRAFFGRIQYGIKDRYFLSFSARRDESPIFAKENRRFTSKAVGLSWRLSEESFMQNQKIFSDLKIRASYGVQGNTPPFQQISLNFGGSASLDPTLTWEKTPSFNLGVDFGLLSNRLTGSLDFFQRSTKDLFARHLLPSNGLSYVITNGGELQTRGAELALQYQALATEKVEWLLGLNASYSTNELTSVSTNAPANWLAPGFLSQYTNITGSAIHSYYVYQQKYTNDLPQEGQYEDLNKDGRIDRGDMKPFHSARPKSLIGFSSQLRYQKWSLGWLARAELGAFNYNREAAQYGFYSIYVYNRVPLNRSTDLLNTNFTAQQFNSSYYVQNASFLRMEYISLGYDAGQLLQNKLTLKLSATVQNAFVLTGYTGQDPEVAYGVDVAQYPRPRTFSLNLNLGF